MSEETEAVAQLLAQHEDQILAEWLQEAGANSTRTTDASRRSMRGEAEEMLRTLRDALKQGAEPEGFQTAAWAPLRREPARWPCRCWRRPHCRRGSRSHTSRTPSAGSLRP